MDVEAVERAQQRLERAAAERVESSAVDAALERARDQMAALAEAAAELEASLPVRLGEALQDGMRAQVQPVARNLAELRGLSNQVIRRLERIEGDQLTERHARVDDLALLVELITSGWRSANERLGRIERKLDAGGAEVYSLSEHVPRSA
jgi:hypothetical protein